MESIALIHAGGSGRAVAGIVALAPHVMVEDLSVASIAAAKVAYATTNLRARLARYHDDVDSAFQGWNDIWLHPSFRAWNIEEYLARIPCGILAIQDYHRETLAMVPRPPEWDRFFAADLAFFASQGGDAQTCRARLNLNAIAERLGAGYGFERNPGMWRGCRLCLRGG